MKSLSLSFVEILCNNSKDNLKPMSNPLIIVAGENLFFNRSSAFSKSEPAIMTTDVVPSPTSLSTVLDASINTFAAGWPTSILRRNVAPSFVKVDSPIMSI